jgi:hypothetical protein
MKRFPNREDPIPTFGRAAAIGVSSSWWESYYKHISKYWYTQIYSFGFLYYGQPSKVKLFNSKSFVCLG